MTSKPISDHAEVSIDFPDKFYHGTFGRESRYEVSADATGVHIHLDRAGEQKRHIAFHLHPLLLGDILATAADALKAEAEKLQPFEREHLAKAAEALAKAMRGSADKPD